MAESQAKSGQQQEGGQQQAGQQQGNTQLQGSQSGGGQQQQKQQGQQGQQGGAVQQRRSGGSLARYSANPFAMMQQLSEEMDQLMESLFYGAPMRRQRQQGQTPSLWIPQIEVQERDNQLLVRVDVPGVSKDDIRIDVQDRVLIVEGERREEHTEGDEKRGFRRTERVYGSFYRAIPLPDGAQAEKAEAKMKDGVLEITIPLAEEKKAQRLEIKE
jgi:HSP20 family protein